MTYAERIARIAQSPDAQAVVEAAPPLTSDQVRAIRSAFSQARSDDHRA